MCQWFISFCPAWALSGASWVPFGTPRPPSPTIHYIPVIASGIPELFKMKESCVESGHFTTIFVNLEEENIYKYILALFHLKVK
jgi:hypothetical protein